MKVKLDIETWERKDHFNFFRNFEEPFYGVCVTMDCTGAYLTAKQNGVSFFLYSLYQCLTAAKLTTSFKYRIEGNEVYSYHQIDAGLTIPRSNGTFGFGHILYNDSFETYMQGANSEVKRVQGLTTLERTPANNLIRFSSLPWIDFTSVSHARMFSIDDSCPKISFGKMTNHNGKRTMPVSIHVHHALVDGLHLGQYIDCLQGLFNGAEV